MKMIFVNLCIIFKTIVAADLRSSNSTEDMRFGYKKESYKGIIDILTRLRQRLASVIAISNNMNDRKIKEAKTQNQANDFESKTTKKIQEFRQHHNLSKKLKIANSEPQNSSEKLVNAFFVINNHLMDDLTEEYRIFLYDPVLLDFKKQFRHSEYNRKVAKFFFQFYDELNLFQNHKKVRSEIENCLENSDFLLKVTILQENHYIEAHKNILLSLTKWFCESIHTYICKKNGPEFFDKFIDYISSVNYDGLKKERNERKKEKETKGIHSASTINPKRKSVQDSAIQNNRNDNSSLILESTEKIINTLITYCHLIFKLKKNKSSNIQLPEDIKKQIDDLLSNFKKNRKTTTKEMLENTIKKFYENKLKVIFDNKKSVIEEIIKSSKNKEENHKKILNDMNGYFSKVAKNESNDFNVGYNDYNILKQLFEPHLRNILRFTLNVLFSSQLEFKNFINDLFNTTNKLTKILSEIGLEYVVQNELKDKKKTKSKAKKSNEKSKSHKITKNDINSNSKTKFKKEKNKNPKQIQVDIQTKKLENIQEKPQKSKDKISPQAKLKSNEFNSKCLARHTSQENNIDVINEMEDDDSQNINPKREKNTNKFDSECLTSYKSQENNIDLINEVEDDDSQNINPKMEKVKILKSPTLECLTSNISRENPSDKITDNIQDSVLQNMNSHIEMNCNPFCFECLQNEILQRNTSDKFIDNIQDNVLQNIKLKKEKNFNELAFEDLKNEIFPGVNRPEGTDEMTDDDTLNINFKKEEMKAYIELCSESLPTEKIQDNSPGESTNKFTAIDLLYLNLKKEEIRTLQLLCSNNLTEKRSKENSRKQNEN